LLNRQLLKEMERMNGRLEKEKEELERLEES